MTVIFVPLALVGIHFEQAGTPLLSHLHVDQAASALSAGGNMEGKRPASGSPPLRSTPQPPPPLQTAR